MVPGEEDTMGDRKMPWDTLGGHFDICVVALDVFAVSFGGAFLQDNRRVRCVWRI